MGIFNREKKGTDTHKGEKPVAPVIKIDSIYRGLDYLVELVKQIRPSNPNDVEEAELKFKALFYHLQHDKSALFSLRKAVLTQFTSSNFVPAITESGMVSSRGFIQELSIKLKHKFLPPLQKPNDFLYVINHVFYKKSDYKWVENLDKKLWIHFFEVLGIHIDVTNEAIVKQLYQALHMLCQRTVSIGMEKEIMDYAPVVPYEEYPFVQLDATAHNYLELLHRNADINDIASCVRELEKVLASCRQLIDVISEQRRRRGTSLSQTYMLFRIQQHLDRLKIIARVLNRERKVEPEVYLDYFIKIIYFEKRKSSLREFMSANFSFLAYKITEHGGIRGEKYITTTRKEYWLMLKSAMGGGFIVSFAALIKNLLLKVSLAPFWQGFAYSVNYAVAFQLMHETNSTLATKQPAFTASALANTLNSKGPNQKPDLDSVAIMVARTVRSQLASFVGNLIVVFPLSYLIAAAYHSIAGTPIVNAEIAEHLLFNQHPLQSFSILFACFTGFFLFLSGVIAGYVENGINFGNVGKRLTNHAFLKNTLSGKKLNKITHYVENHFGALVGNVSLGFMLGMAGFIGNIFGIPFDIRHVTISAANAAIAFYTRGYSDGIPFLATVVGGVFLIGFFNFLVSFALAFLVAIKSRGLRLRDYPELFGVIIRFFLRYPFDFVFPPKAPRTVEEVRRKDKKEKKS